MLTGSVHRSHDRPHQPAARSARPVSADHHRQHPDRLGRDLGIATLNDANAVGAIGPFTATTGLSFTNAAGFSAGGIAGGTATNLVATTGALTLTGNISGTATSLTAGSAINQTGGVITAATLTGSAGTSAALNDANAVGAIGPFTATTGLSFSRCGHSRASPPAASINGGTARPI